MRRNPLQFVVRGIALVIVLILWLLVSPTTAFFWTLFIVWAAFRLDSRIIGIGALALLAAIPVSLMFKEYAGVSEQLAVYVFFLFCITVALQLLELRRDPEEDTLDIFSHIQKIPLIKRHHTRKILKKQKALSRQTPQQEHIETHRPSQITAIPLKKRRVWDMPRKPIPRKKPLP